MNELNKYERDKYKYMKRDKYEREDKYVQEEVVRRGMSV